MKKILLFGGAFNPPHIGHRHLLSCALLNFKFDKVMCVISNISPHKQNEKFLSNDQKISELKTLFYGLGNIEISDIELKRPTVSYTIDTVNELKNDDNIIYLLMGSDMFLSFEKWKDFKSLLKKVIILTMPRQKNEVNKLYDYKAYLIKNYDVLGIEIMKEDAVVMSSSQIRQDEKALIERIINHIENNLSEEKINHSKSVANYAKKLAKRFGVNERKAYIAGLAHDCTKHLNKEAQLLYFKENNIVLTDDQKLTPKIYHQISGAHFAKNVLKIDDEEIINAIACHTTGKENMTALDKIIFFADSAEPLRDYDGVEKLREAIEKSLDDGVKANFDNLIISIIKRDLSLNLITVNARNYLINEMRKD